jgi:hypothetical protein
MFSNKAKKIDKIFTADLTLSSKCQIDGEDFVIFCGLLRKHEFYQIHYYFYLAFNLQEASHIIILYVSFQ